MKKLLILILAIFFMSYAGYSRPQYSILQAFGMKCQNCHFNVQGGGVRTNSGWASRNDLALYNPGFLGILKNTNTFLKEMVTFGVDFRYQNAKWPGPPVLNADKTQKEFLTTRKSMIMQLSPYLVVQPFKWLFAEGFYNLAYEIEKNHYPGQQPGAWSVNFRPSDDLPYLRVGCFQPTLGTKFDDHTVMIYRVINKGSQYAIPTKPDDYAEWGAQLDYEKYSWFGASLGLFQSKGLGIKEYSIKDYLGNYTFNPALKTPPRLLVNTDRPSIVGRLAFYPNLGSIMGHTINTMFGGMIYYNGPMGSNTDLNEAYYYFGDLFFHIGLTDRLALMTEYTQTRKQFARVTNNFLVELNYQVLEPWNVFVRCERATTKTNDWDKDQNYIHPFAAANQFVIGSHIFPLPYIDLLPEYRIYRSEEFPGTQQSFAVQLHVFY